MAATCSEKTLLYARRNEINKSIMCIKHKALQILATERLQ